MVQNHFQAETHLCLAVRGDLRALLAVLLGADQLPGVLPRRGPQERGLQGVPGVVRDAEGLQPPPPPRHPRAAHAEADQILAAAQGHPQEDGRRADEEQPDTHGKRRQLTIWCPKLRPCTEEFVELNLVLLIGKVCPKKNFFLRQNGSLEKIFL